MKSSTDPVSLVISSLEKKYASISLGGLREQAQHIEDDIQAVVAASGIDYFSARKSFKAVGANEFIFDGKLYRLSIGAAVTSPSLHVCILNAMEPAGRLSSSGVRDISGVGYFNSFELQLPEALKGHIEPLSASITKIYKAAYTWLEEEFFKNIKALENGFADALYQHLRVPLCADGKIELASQVWFSIFSERNGFYALDGKAVTRILETLKLRRFSSELSPLSHLVSLIGLEMPYGKSLSKYAIAKSGYHEFSLKKAAYISDMGDIFKTEEQMTLGGAYAIFPLGSIGERKLVAAFPSSLKESLLPVFDANKKKFSEIYSRETKTLKRHLAKIQSSYRRLDTAELGGLIGGILGGIFKNL